MEKPAPAERIDTRPVTSELAAPFVVDDTWLSEIFPQLDDWVATGVALAEPSVATNINEILAREPRTVQMRTIYYAAGRLLAEVPADDRKAEAKCLFNQFPQLYATDPVLQQTHFITDVEKSFRFASAYEKFRDDSETVTTLAEGLSEHSKEIRYYLLKVMAASAAEKEDTPKTIFTQMSALRKSATGQPGFPEKLLSELEAGQYDLLIARDVLEMIATHPVRSNASYRQLESWFWEAPRVAGRQTRNDAENIGYVVQRLLRDMEKHPETLELFMKARTRLKKDLLRSVAEAESLVQAAGFGAASTDDMAELQAAVNRFMNRNRTARMPGGADATETGPVRGIRKTKVKVPPRALSDVEVHVVAEQKPASNKLTYIKIDADKHARFMEEGTPDFDEMITDFISKNGGDPKLPGTVERVLAKMKAIDEAAGIHNGSKHREQTVKYDGEEHRVVAFRSGRVRALCVRTKDGWGILSLTNRKNAARTERGLVKAPTKASGS